MQDFYIIQVAVEADGAIATAEGEAAAAFIQWCDSYIVTPAECPPDDPAAALASSALTEAFSTEGHADGTDGFGTFFEGRPFAAQPGDFEAIECDARAKCAWWMAGFVGALSTYVGSVIGMSVLGAMAAPLLAIYGAALVALGAAVALAMSVYQLAVCAYQQLFS